MQRIILLAILSAASAFTRTTPRSCSVSTTTALNAASALIVQNKGGGHGELGYQLAKVLETQHGDKIDSITILQDDACKDTAEPFASYATDLPHVHVVKAPLSRNDDNITAETLQDLLSGQSFDYVWDNCSKNDQGAGKAVCDLCKTWNVQLLTYVSSAGMYTPAADGPFPMSEDTTPIKESAGQNKYDQYAVSLGLPLVSFRPQYIYGPKANKHDYIDWYFDRLVRNLPLPIPGDGQQLVSLTNSEDVASLLAAPLTNQQAAVEQRYFNCGTDQLVSYDNVGYLCAEAAGIAREKVMIEHYDADMFGKAKFPFRLTNFYVAPEKAKEILKWPGAAHSLKDDLPAYFESYKARGGPEKQMHLGEDWEIVVGCKTPKYDQVGSIYDPYMPTALETD